MRAIVFTGKNDASFTRLPDPAPTPLRARSGPAPDPGEGVMDVRASGICNTDTRHRQVAG